VFHFLYKKEYNLDTETAIKRYKIFKNNLKVIEEHNAKKLSWWYSINEFTDLTDEEFNELFNLKPKTNEIMELYEKFLDFDEMADKDDEIVIAPKGDINWLHTLPPPRRQGACGSCWAFATMGAIESAYAIKNNKICPYLSPQQLLDCDTDDNACNGGTGIKSFRYIKWAGGAMMESDYPYVAKRETCKFDISKVKVKISNYSICATCAKERWLSLIAGGAISVSLSAKDGLKNYGGGIIKVSGDECKEIDHNVLAYAWTTEKTGAEFISIRNSWGESWGDKGNFHIYYTKEANDTCYVTKLGYLPIL